MANGVNFDGSADLGPVVGGGDLFIPPDDWKNPNTHDGTFTKAVARGTDEMQGGMYSAAKYIGELTGIDPIVKWGEEGFQKNLREAANNPAEIGTWDNVHSLADFGTYVLEAIGSQVPNLAVMAAGGGAGGLAARAAIGKAAAQRLGITGLSKTVERGGLAGAAAVNYPMQVGETYQNLEEAGIKAPGTVALAGALKTVLDTASFGVGIGQLFKGLDRDMAKDLVTQLAQAYVDTGKIPLRALLKPVAKQAGAGALVSGSAESGTEALQAVIDNAARAFHDPSFDPFGDEALKDVRESAIQALIVGGLPGAVGRGGRTGITLLQERADALQKMASGSPTVPPGAQPQPPAGVPPAPPAAAPESVPEQPVVDGTGQPETAPEPVADVAAQTQDLKPGELRFFDGVSPADAVFRRSDLAVIPTDNGSVYVAPKADEEQARARVEAIESSPDPDTARAKELGYQQAKSEIPVETATAVVGKNDAGAVVHSELVDGTKPEVVEAAKGTAEQRGATDVQVQSPVEAVTDRVNRVREEGEYVVTPERAYFKGFEAPQDTEAKPRVAARLTPRERIKRQSTAADRARRHEPHGDREQAERALGLPPSAPIESVLDPSELEARQDVSKSQEEADWTGEITYGKRYVFDPKTGKETRSQRLPGKHVRELGHANSNAKLMKLFHYLTSSEVPKNKIPELMKDARFRYGLERKTDTKTGKIVLARKFPDRQFRGEGEDPRVFNAFLRAVNIGEYSRDLRTQWDHPAYLSRSPVGGRAGTPAVIRLDTKSLAFLGRAINEGNYRDQTPLGVGQNIQTAMAFLRQLGFVFRGTPVEEVKKHASETGAPPRDATKRHAGLEIGVDGDLVPHATVYTGPRGEKWDWEYLTETVPRLYQKLQMEYDRIDQNLETARRGPYDPATIEPLVEQRKALRTRLYELGAYMGEGKDENAAKELVAGTETSHTNTHETKWSLTKDGNFRAERGEANKRVVHETSDAMVPADESADVDPETDVSGFETDADQAEASANAVNTEAKTAESEALAELTKSLTDTGVVTRGSAETQKLGDIASALLSHIGLGKPAAIMTDGTVSTDEKHAGADHLAVLERAYPHLKEAFAAIRRDKPMGRIIFPNREAARERVPIIYISPEITDQVERGRVMLHELGHLVEKLAFDTAPQAVKDALVRQFGHDQFSERFADALQHWVGARMEPNSIVERFFKALADTLKKMWAKFMSLTGATSEQRRQMAFNDFMDSLVVARLIKAGSTLPAPQMAKDLVDAVRSPVPGKTDSAAGYETFDYTPTDAWQQVRGYLGETRARKTEVAWDAAKLVSGKVWDTLAVTLGDYMKKRFDSTPAIRQLLTDKVYKFPGDPTSYAGQTLYQLYDSMGFDTLLHEIYELYPKVPWFGRAKVEARGLIRDINAEVYSDVPIDQLKHPAAKKIREALMAINQRALENGKTPFLSTYEDDEGRLRYARVFRPDEMPLMVDSAKLGLHKKEFVASMVDAGWNKQDAEYYHDQLTNLYPAFVKFGKKPGLEFSDATEALQSRKIPPEVAPFLEAYVTRDALHTLDAYHNYMVRSMAVHKLFGVPRELRNARSKEGKDLRKRFKDAGISISSSTAQLDYDLKKLHTDKVLSDLDYRELTESILPQVLGRVPIHPLARMVNSFFITWMNWAKMPLSLLSQTMDLGVIAHQFRAAYGTGGAISATAREMRKHFTKTGREYNLRLLRAIGMAHETSTLHIMADGSVGSSSLAPWANRANETLFKYNGMRWWSAASRSVAMNLAIHQVRMWGEDAKAGDAHAIDALEKLGIRKHEAIDFANGFDANPEALLSYNTKVQTVRNGILRMIDESALRPNPALRPQWGNNPKLAVFWHLKSWIWAYHNMILRPVWHAMKEQKGIAKAAPLIILMMHTLLFTSLGYAVRELIAQRPKQFQADGPGGWFWQILQRSGTFGIIQMGVDAAEAGQYGRSPFISLLGPTVSTADSLLSAASSGSGSSLKRAAIRALPLSQLIVGAERAIK